MNSPADTSSGRSCSSPRLAEATGVEALLAGAGEHRLHLADEAAGADRRGAARRATRPTRGCRAAARAAPRRAPGPTAAGWRRRRARWARSGARARRRRSGRCEHETAEVVARDPRGHPVAQLLGGLAGEGERQHRVGRGAAVLDAVDDRLDQRRGLAGAGTGQHEQRAARVVDHALLVLVELGHHDLAVGADEPVAPAPGGGRGAHAGHPITRDRQRAAGPADGVSWRCVRCGRISRGRRSRRPGRRPRGPGGRPRPRRRPPGRR